MIHMDRFVMKPLLVYFTSSVLHLTVVLLLLTHSCGGQSQMIGQSQPIVAMVGDDIILPCQLESAVDAYDLTVEWARPDLDPRFVHFRRDGVELQPEEHQSYRGRTSLSNNKLKHGDISLKVSKVGLSDAGTYRCLIPTFNAESMVELVVGSVSSADIKISKVSNGALLECKSKGWYPEPDVFWLDGEDKLLSAGPTETVRGPDNFYTVSSRMTVEKTPSNSFTCRVQQRSISQTRETQIQIPDDLFMVQSSPAIRITICVAACIMSIVAVALIVWKGKRNKIETTNNELQLLMMEERDKELLMTESEKLKYLEKTKAKLDEDSQKTDEELQYALQVIETLTEQKKDLKKQRDELLLFHQEDKRKIEEIQNKKIPTTDREKKMQKREEAKKYLEKRKTEHEELKKSTDKLLETTEGLINQMTERKAKLEKDKEQTNRYLKETDRQREECQRKLELEQSEKEKEKNNPSSNNPI